MRLAAVLSVIGLSACATAQLVSALSDYAVMPAYSAEELQRAVANRSLPVLVHGRSPADDIAAGMNRSGALGSVQFRATASDNPGNRYRVVWNFAPPVESIAPNEICAAAPADGRRAGPSVDAYAAFCRGDQ